MKFFTIAGNLAHLYYKASNPQYKMNLLELLTYMYFSENHSKYLDDVRHPAKKERKNNEEYTKLEEQIADALA